MSFDWNTLFHVEWTLAFGFSILNIMFINLILSGDNAVLIAMAVKNLPDTQRKSGIAFGTAAAVILRIVLTFFVALLLEISFVKFIGGMLILWIAVKLLMESNETCEGKEATTLWQAIKIILIADITMSLDNVLAVAGAAEGNLFLLMFGLLMSIPIVVLTSDILCKLMDKYPIIIIIGGAILGRVGGEMIIGDHFIENWLHPSKTMDYGFQVICTIGVVVLAKLLQKWKASKANASTRMD